MKNEIISIITKREEIEKILEKVRIFDFDDLRKHSHFEFSVMEKLTNIDFLRKIYPQFGLIRSIQLRENERGKRYYGLFYELEDGTFAVISLVIDVIPPMIINGFHANKSYKRFEKSLRKNYFNKFI